MFGCFRKKLNIIQNTASFTASDGIHHATISNDNSVALQMKDVDSIKTDSNYTF